MKLQLTGYFLGLLLILPLIGISQQTKIVILDKINNEPVAFANAVISPIENNTVVTGYVSDEKGVINAIIEEKSLIRLTYIGFYDYVDTTVILKCKFKYKKNLDINKFILTDLYFIDTNGNDYGIEKSEIEYQGMIEIIKKKAFNDFEYKSIKE